MTVQIFELAPPQIRAVRYTGTNAAEIGELVGHDGIPQIQTDADGVRFLSFVRYLDLGGEAEMRLRESEWATIDHRGVLNVLPDAGGRPDGWRLAPTVPATAKKA